MSYLGCPSSLNHCELSQAVVVDSPDFVVITNLAGNTRFLIDSHHASVFGAYQYEQMPVSQFAAESAIYALFFFVLYALLYFRR